MCYLLVALSGFQWTRNPRKSNASLMCGTRALARDCRRPSGLGTSASALRAGARVSRNGQGGV
jgi:hypothetical protein